MHVITPTKFYVFETPLGWMAIVCRRGTVLRLTLGHTTAEEARQAAHHRLDTHAQADEPDESLVARICNYAAGKVEDFRDVSVDISYLTPLGQTVFDRCREIPFGQTCTYGELADDVGRPGAARAVGQFMASNRTPLLVPCHRVVAAGGRLGGFTAPGGISLKKRLLDLESAEK